MEDLIKVGDGISKQSVGKLVGESISSTHANQHPSKLAGLLIGLSIISDSIIFGVQSKGPSGSFFILKVYKLVSVDA